MRDVVIDSPNVYEINTLRVYLNLVMIGTYQTLRETSNAFSAACLGSRLGIFWALLVSAKGVDQSVNLRIYYLIPRKKEQEQEREDENLVASGKTAHVAVKLQVASQ